MKFASKCPKCGGEIQTKSIHKSIGLGYIDIPVAQFCLNPVCDWYQDFSEAKKAEDIKEGVVQIKLPSFKKKAPREPQETTQKISPGTLKNIAALGGVIIFIAALIYVIPLFTQSPDTTAGAPPANATPVPTPTPTQTPTEALQAQEPKAYPVKFDVKNGFVPVAKTGGRPDVSRSDIIINRSDTVVWNSEESRQYRVYLVSRDGLFDKRLMVEGERFSYQFNASGNYTFALAEYATLKEFPNATGRVIVR